MSLKALKIVVNGSLRSAHDPDSEDCFHCHAVKAEAEIAALKKAAKELETAGALKDLATYGNTIDAAELLATIAKESE